MARPAIQRPEARKSARGAACAQTATFASFGEEPIPPDDAAHSRNGLSPSVHCCPKAAATPQCFDWAPDVMGTEDAQKPMKLAGVEPCRCKRAQAFATEPGARTGVTMSFKRTISSITTGACLLFAGTAAMADGPKGSLKDSSSYERPFCMDWFLRWRARRPCPGRCRLDFHGRQHLQRNWRQVQPRSKWWLRRRSGRLQRPGWTLGVGSGGDAVQWRHKQDLHQPVFSRERTE